MLGVLTLGIALLSFSPAAHSRESALGATPAWAFPAASRLVAIGDLHGDVAAAQRALRAAGAIDERERWIGGPLVVVQTGDQLDRGDDDLAVQQLLERLQPRAAKAGGRLLVLNGNHEVMNVAGDFRYVSPRSLQSYAHFAPADPADLSAGRRTAFAPGGPVAKAFATRPVIATVGGVMFVHGGVLLRHVEYGLERINREVSAFMTGAAPPTAATVGEDAPIWTRLYSDGTPSAQACAELSEVLKRTNTRRLVVGHTIQPEINSACDGKVWRIDVGMSRHYGGPTQVLEIKGDTVRIVRGQKPAAAQEPATAH